MTREVSIDADDCCLQIQSDSAFILETIFDEDDIEKEYPTYVMNGTFRVSGYRLTSEGIFGEPKLRNLA
jgi:hypothetical protein